MQKRKRNEREERLKLIVRMKRRKTSRFFVSRKG